MRGRLGVCQEQSCSKRRHKVVRGSDSATKASGCLERQYCIVVDNPSPRIGRHPTRMPTTPTTTSSMCQGLVHSARGSVPDLHYIRLGRCDSLGSSTVSHPRYDPRWISYARAPHQWTVLRAQVPNPGAGSPIRQASSTGAPGLWS